VQNVRKVLLGMGAEATAMPQPLRGALLHSLLLCALASFWLATVAHAQRVAVCHKPGPKQKILNVEAVDAGMHLGHGDRLVSSELCNGVDDDCDGVADDDIAAVPTTCGVGECGASGLLTCTAGTPVDSCTPGPASDELCNGLDDDCDGVADNDPIDLDSPCTVGVGVCQATGAEICNEGTRVCDATPGTPPEEFESTCDDALDNDCDGTSDGSDPSCVDCPGWTLAELNLIQTPGSPADCTTSLACQVFSGGARLSCRGQRIFIVEANNGVIECSDQFAPFEECDADLVDQPALSVQSCAEILLRSDLWADFCGG